MDQLNKCIEEYNANGFSADLVSHMKELREVFKASGDPKVTRTLRLAYQQIAASGDFVVDILDEDEERTEEDPHSFLFFLELLNAPNNKFNRDDIEEYKQALLQYET